MPRAESGLQPQSGAGQRKLWRVLCFLWAGVLVVALLAPWPYALAAVLFTTFVHFAALDERRELEREPEGPPR